MAWGVKYKHQFYDIHEVIWTTEIYEEGFAGAVTTFKGSSNPLNFEFYGDDDIFNQNVLGSKMTLDILVNSNFVYDDLFTSDDLEFKVIVSHEAVEYWTGYIQANNYQEPYDHLPIKVTLTAIDGLGLLKNFKFADMGFVNMERETMSTIIYDILELVGISSFTEYINIYEDSMDAADGDSSLEQMGIDPELYEESSCYEVLEGLLSTFNAGIRQDLNIITLYRFVEVKEATMYGRIFTSGSDQPTDITKAPLQYLKRSAQASNLWDYDGGTRMIIPQAKQTLVNYNLGLKQSILKNWEFLFDDFVESGGVYSIPNWASTIATVTISPTSSFIGGEGEGIYLLGNADSRLTAGYITQTVSNIKSRSPSFKLSYEVRFHNAHSDVSTASVHYLLQLTGNPDTYYWVKVGTQLGIGTQWLTSGSNTYDTFTDIPMGMSEWHTIEHVISSIPDDGDLVLRLYAAINADSVVNIEYRNVKIVMTPVEGSDETGIAYTVDGATTGQLIEKDMDLGDGFTVRRYTVNQLLNYHGIINAYNSGGGEIDPGNTWFTKGNAENVALLDLISSELGAQFVRQKDKIDLPLRERTADTFLSLTGNIKDTSNTYGGNPRTFAITRGSYSVKMREWDLTLNEII